MKKTHMKFAALVLAVILAISTFAPTVFAAQSGAYELANPKYYLEIVDNPYDEVNWDTFGQYKANLHLHTSASPDVFFTTLAQQLERYYTRGFDIISINDHAIMSNRWDERPTLLNGNPASTTPLTTARYEQMLNGVGRDGRRMTQIMHSIEQTSSGNSAVDGGHILSYYANWNSPTDDYISTIAGVEANGGLTVFAHIGRYVSLAQQENRLAEYVGYLMDYPSLIGFEAFNGPDNETYNDRIFWDKILMETAPLGRNFYGFSNDDTHDSTGLGAIVESVRGTNMYNYSMFLMEENTDENVRAAMEKGAFFASTKRTNNVNSLENIGGYLNNSLPQPSVTRMEIDNTVIRVEAQDAATIEWVADGKVFATGSEVDLADYNDEINHYVRFIIKGAGGVTISNPILLNILQVDFATVDAYVTKLNGNKNDLTITVTEHLSNGTIKSFTETFSINNNAAGTYEVNDYVVYVDTKGNTQIRACYITGMISEVLIEIVDEINDDEIDAVEPDEINNDDVDEPEEDKDEMMIIVEVEKLEGSQNELTITIEEETEDGTVNEITETFLIDNNAEGTYEVGDYEVYVDTKGNDQIRDAYIVE